MATRYPILMFLAFASLSMAGCSGSKSPPAVPVAVTGQVVDAAKKPITGMLITFHLQGGAQAGNSRSDPLDKQGRFKVEIIPGQYKVTLAPIPSQHGVADATGELAVPPGKGSEAKKPAKDKGIPHAYSDAQSSPWEVTIPPEGKELTLTIK
jgi:hypothetical protein